MLGARSLELGHNELLVGDGPTAQAMDARSLAQAPRRPVAS